MFDTELVPMDSAQLLAGLFDPNVEGALTDDERTVLSTLILKEGRVDVAIPETIENDRLWDAIKVCSSVSVRVQRVEAVLKMLLGRALLIMQTRPVMYTSLGFKSFEEFVTSPGPNGLKALTGVSRNEAYATKRVVTILPMISTSEASEIGFSKMKELTRVVRKDDSRAQEWIEKAKNMTLLQLKDAVYRSDNQIPPGSLEFDTLIIPLNKDEKLRITEFLKTPEYQAYCESAQPAAMLLRAIEEATAEWTLQIREQEES